MTKILHIDTDQQTPNRLFYDGTGNVKQVTDKASNIPFTQPDIAKQPVLNITEGAFEFDYLASLKVDNFNLQYTYVGFWLKFRTIPTTGMQYFYDCFESTSANLSVRYDGSTNQLQMRYNSASWAGDTFIPTVDTWYFIGILVTKRATVAENIIFIDSTEFIRYLETNLTPINAQLNLLGIGDVNDGAYSIKNYVQYSLTDQEITDQEKIEIHLKNFKNPFPYFKRYKEDGNKKLFLSSRYLEGADIDRNGEITIINSELQKYTKSIGARNPIKRTILTTKGIYSDGTSDAILLPIDNTTQTQELFTIGGGDFYIGCWFMKTASISTSNTLFWQQGTNGINFRFYPNFPQFKCYLYFDNVGYEIDYNLGENMYRYISFLRKNGVIYLLIDGALVFQANNNAVLQLNNLTASVYLRLLTQDNVTADPQYMDDFYFVNGDSIINPTGYAIGYKVFQPPARRSLDNRFIQL